MCKNYLSILALCLAAALANLPAASATTITDAAPNGPTSVAGVGSLPLAQCSAAAESDQRESLHHGLAACLDASIGPSMESLLRLFGGISPTTTVLASATSTGSTVVLGPLCTGSQAACFATSTPTASTSVSTVPEPGTLALLAPGLIGLIGLARRGRLLRGLS